MSSLVYPNDWCVSQQSQGSSGGSAFTASVEPISTTVDGAAVALVYAISRIDCWIAAHRMVGIKVYFSASPDGYSPSDTSYMFGATGGAYSNFYFDAGERLTSLHIYKAHYNKKDYCGGLSFVTSLGRSFSAQSGNSKDGVSMNVGYGLPLGIFGRSGEAIDALGFWMTMEAKSVTIDETAYGDTPADPAQEIFYDQIYTNATDTDLSESYTHSSTATDSQSWTQTTEISESLGVTVSLSADVYDISVGVEGTAAWTKTRQTMTGGEYSTEITNLFETDFTVPAKSAVRLVVSYYTGGYSLTYTGLATVRLVNNNSLAYYLQGETSGASTSGLLSTLTPV